MAEDPARTLPLVHCRNAPPYLRGLTGEQLWQQYRRNGKSLWCVWDCDEDYGVDISLLAAAEIIEDVEAAGGTIEINLDVTLPPGAPVEANDMDREYLVACGRFIKELLRFQRESTYNLGEVADR